MEPQRLQIPSEAYRHWKDYPGAEHILHTLRKQGHEAYLVGGCVRDILLGRQPKDFDIASSAPLEELSQLFPKTVPIGERFGTLGVMVEATLYQVTRFRSEGDYRDARHPERVQWASAREDAWRRDFTINGLFADPFQNTIIDFVGGKEDLDRGVIRAIGNPNERFREDALRLLRAARFASRFQFVIEERTWRAIQEQAESILKVSAERVRDELILLLTERRDSSVIVLLDQLGLLAPILPEIVAMKGVEQPAQYHPEGDVFVHTLLVLDKLESTDVNVVFAALLHDIAKPATFERADRIRFHGHDALGVVMAEKVLRRLCFSRQQIEEICELIEFHLYIADLPKMREAKRNRFLARPNIEKHLALHRADCLGAHGNLEIYDYCREQLAKLPEERLRPPKLLNGHDLEALGYRPGPQFAVMLSSMEEQQLEGQIVDREQALAWIRKQFPKNP